jgi:phosphoribosylformylglycinamidine (FGAM) synthase PurS component
MADDFESADLEETSEQSTTRTTHVIQLVLEAVPVKSIDDLERKLLSNSVVKMSYLD